MVQGSCLCGKIEFEGSESNYRLANCHCSLCRKSHGAAYATLAVVPSDSFKITSGESYLSKFEATKNVERCFCSICGSGLFNLTSKWPLVSIVAGSIDSKLAMKPKLHVFYENKENWCEISDDLPKFNTWPQ